MEGECKQYTVKLSTVDGARVVVNRARQRLSMVPITVWQVLLAIAIATCSFFFGERIAIRDGLGWEGVEYWAWVKDFPREIREVGIDAYRIQRILPSAIIYSVFRAFRIAPTIENSLLGFAALNVMSIGLVALFWCLTANRLRISDRGKWLGFIILMLNFAVLKCSGYYVVMIDMPAYANGAAMVYCYLTRRRVSLWGITVLGAFLWPTQLYIGTVLSLFPKSKDKDHGSVPNSQMPASAPVRFESKMTRWRLNWIVAFFAAYYFCVWAYYACGRIQAPIFGGLLPIKSLLVLSLGIAAVYLLWMLVPLLNDRQLFQLPRSFSLSQVGWTIGTISVALGTKLVQSQLCSRPGYFGFNAYVLVVGISAVAKPGLFLLAHLIYFGPAWLLALVHWPTICRYIHAQHGKGLTLAIAIGVCHCLDAESRHLVYLVPLVVPFVVQAIQRLDWTRGQILFLTALSILTSKCWMHIGGPFLDNANEFPDQYFWMNVGTFMTNETYLWQLLGAAVCALGLYQVLPRSDSAVRTQTNQPNITGDFGSETIGIVHSRSA